MLKSRQSQCTTQKSKIITVLYKNQRKHYLGYFVINPRMRITRVYVVATPLACFRMLFTLSGTPYPFRAHVLFGWPLSTAIVCECHCDYAYTFATNRLCVYRGTQNNCIGTQRKSYPRTRVNARPISAESRLDPVQV